MIKDKDIKDKYKDSVDERKIAVGRVLESKAYVLSALMQGDSDNIDYAINVDWMADQVTSTALIVGLVQIGIKQFGDVWLHTLKDSLKWN